MLFMNSQNLGSVLSLERSDSIPKNLFKIRIIFVSSNPNGCLKAKHKIALAVYFPIPGRDNRSF